MAEAKFLAPEPSSAALEDRAVIERIIERLENFYAFECEGGPLRNCLEWVAMKHIALEIRDLVSLWSPAMSEQDKLINRLEGDVELRDQNIAELCEDFTSALTAFRALSRQWRDEATEEAIWLVARTCTRHADDLDALLVSLSAPTDHQMQGGSKLAEP